MPTYSKLMCEYIVTANVNDRMDITDAASNPQTATIAAGRYRDHIALAAAFESALDAATLAGTGQTWEVSVADSTGIFTIRSTTWTVDWNTSTYGTTLRDDLGYTGSEALAAGRLVASSCHLGGFYPPELVEQDNRPLPTGTDRWGADAYQQVSASGYATTIGGDQLVYRRQVQFLLHSDDVESFQEWLQRAAKGYSFAFYHDRSQTWPGPSSEYDEYKIDMGDSGDFGYEPEPIEPTNMVWFRAVVPMIQRVEPGA